jgi:hypothetical protein
MLKGDSKLEKRDKKVLKSGPNDHVFIYYFGHGDESGIKIYCQYTALLLNIGPIWEAWRLDTLYYFLMIPFRRCRGRVRFLCGI